MQYLNLGCGQRFHPQWHNIDFTATGEAVIAHNLTLGIPAETATFDVVYHSHVLEHFAKNQAPTFLQECYRVLKPGGTIRVVIPDLEQIAKTYLFTLEKAQINPAEWHDNYDWMTIELLDQSIRNHSGGDMAAYLNQASIPNQSFVLNRIGSEGKQLIEQAERGRSITTPTQTAKAPYLQAIYRFIRYPEYRRNAILKFFLNAHDYEALTIGRFRVGGEVHQWMYDRYSLAKLLSDTGFTQILQRSATESGIPNWRDFNLDTEVDGSVYKPDSLFMEAIKPTS